MSRFVIRPGETCFDAEHRVQGSLDLPLSSQGREQLDAVVHRLLGSGVEVIYTSPTEPALSSAEYVAEAMHLPCKSLDKLANVHMGLWQGMTWDEIRRKQPRVFKQWEDAPESVCPPQGETCSEAYERVVRALWRPMRKVESFAVFAPEPVASIVSCVLRRAPLRVSDPLAPCPQIEEIAGEAQLVPSMVSRWLGM